jgi:hypothetical protein
MQANRTGSAIAALVAIGLFAAACSGTSEPGVASLGSTTTTSPAAGSSSTNNATNYSDALKYTQCMRTHGVLDFPDPISGIPFKRGLAAHEAGIDTSSSQFGKANLACQHLLANGGVPSGAQAQEAVAEALQLAQCMRSHGVPNFPDPTESNGQLSLQLSGSGLDANSPQYRAANAACKQYTPGGVGLPDPDDQADAG